MAAPDPQNLEAECAVLGAMLKSDAAIQSVLPILQKEHFYRSSYGVIFEQITELFQQGVPVDVLAVITALEASQRLVEAGGKVRVQELPTLAGSTTQAPRYGSMIRDCWQKRELLVALRGAAAKTLNGSTPDEAFAAAERGLLQVRLRCERGRESVVSGYEAASWFEQKVKNPPSEERGIKVPFSFLKRWQPSRLYVMSGYTADGKALSLDTPLPTPNGWTTMGRVQSGDRLFDEHGQPCSVLRTSAIQHGRKVFNVTFADGSVIKADAEHLWSVSTHQSRASARRFSRRMTTGRRQQPLELEVVRTTEELIKDIHVDAVGRRNFAVRVAAPLQLPELLLPIDPYVLGCWLGDGHTHHGQITGVDEEIFAGVTAADYSVVATKAPITRGIHGLERHLRLECLIGNKHIPVKYLRASESQRLSLFQGLMDTDGYVSGRGQCEFTSTNESLAEDVLELALTLGIKATMRVGRATLYGKDCGPKYRIMFTTAFDVARLERKRQRLLEETSPACEWRMIASIEEIPSEPVKCVMVDSPSHLYLAGRSMIPTHNTVAGVQFAAAAASDKAKVGVFTLEMSWEDMTNRIISSFGVPLHDCESGRIKDEHMAAYKRAAAALALWRIDLIDDEALTIAKIASAQSLGRYDFIIIDHLHQMDYVDRRELERNVTAIGNLARRFHIPILLLAQIHRKDDKFPRPTLSDLRETGVIENVAAMVAFVWRKRDERKQPTEEAEFIIAKNRYGRTGYWPLRFDGQNVRFEVPA